MKYSLYPLLLISFFIQAQDSNVFADEILAIQKKYDTLWDSSKETIVFTGSSSIRMWHNLQDNFPQHQIINSGFGGSKASDLLQNTKALILQFQPSTVFIYEGDNDIAGGEKSKKIIANIAAIISKIKKQNPNAKINLIAAKPSLARWHLRRKYKRLNKKLKKLSKPDKLISYVDVWKPMLNGKKLKQDIFIADGLHMNAEGYAIWYEIIKPYLIESNN